MFSRVRNPFLIFLLSYHVSLTLKIQANFRYKRYLKVLMNVSYEFLNFFHYFCFRGWGIHFWYSYWATMFQWLRKSRSTSGTGGTRRYRWLCLIDFWNFLTIYVFEVRESISDIATQLLCSGVSENPDQLPVQEVLMILSYEFWKFLQYLCFQGQGIHCWHSYWATVFEWHWKSLVNFRYRRYWWFCLMNFGHFFSIYVFEVKESIADIPTELPCLADLKTSRTGNWPRFLRSPKRGSSVGISAMDSLTLKTQIVGKFQKSIRQNHQYRLNRKLTWIFEVTQTW